MVDRPDIVAPHGFVELLRFGAIKMIARGFGSSGTRRKHSQIRGNHAIRAKTCAQRRNQLGADLTKCARYQN